MEKTYYDKNRAIRCQYQREYAKTKQKGYRCYCGGIFKLINKTIHDKTKRHINYLKSLDHTIDL